MGDHEYMCNSGLICIACDDFITDNSGTEVGENYLCRRCAKDNSIRKDYGLAPRERASVKRLGQ